MHRKFAAITVAAIASAAIMVAGAVTWLHVIPGLTAAPPTADTLPTWPETQSANPYHDHMRNHVPGAADWSNEWMDGFAVDVCEAIETWPGDAPAVDVVYALVDQWGWSVDHAGVAVNAAAAEGCPEHAPVPAVKITREGAR